VGEFGVPECAAFVAGKEAMWREHGFGPWAIVIVGEFAGWGGVQPEDGEADLALVLHPRFWGSGRAICERVLHEAFSRFGLASVTVLLPLSRGAGIVRLGFQPEGETLLAGVRFRRYRLPAIRWRARA
jgi:hypothetical protein